MSAVTVEGVYKKFGGMDVIKNVDLHVADGEFVVLVGPSGCGKSTLLRLVAGLETVSGGVVKIGDRVANALSPRERNIAMVFQGYALYPHMTVADNISFNLKLAGDGRQAIAEKLQATAGMLELLSLLKRYPGELSGGQRQRVAMGRALVREPEVFLFDEPLSNLDAKLRGQMRTEIKGFHQRLGITTLYVTHDQIEAMTLADRVVVLDGGRVQQQGCPLELYSDPKNKFVAGFIGSPPMNFLDAVIVDDHGRLTARIANGGGMLVLGSGRDLREGQSVVLGLRPEHIRCRDELGTIQGHVRYVEPTGAHAHITYEVGGQAVIALVDSSFVCDVGERMSLSVLPGSELLFDPETGERI